ncbi:twitching motility protein PilT [Parablautia muri]|uniref:Twitching motility protein PilT n=1 Tax=Parablautia muri TaxID=2320879 RepID=A0A9X5BCV8_9FIRM|nr:twitching motility protein PilT [Parablautia muri]NBJ91431.1 twitching motility protein PilT [Parablautia muri]
MVQLIVGNKGKGKTKHLLDQVNAQVQSASGNLVYLDKSTKHMYELNNKIRLIDVSSYLLTDSDEFVGFISGIISQDHDLEQVYVDNFLKIAHLEKEGSDIEPVIQKLDKLSDAFNINFYVSISLDDADIPASLKDKIAVSL